jgi:Ca-activated chloride channel family protein
MSARPAMIMAACFVCAAAAILGAEQVHFKSGVDLVRIEALVTDAGRPVRGLTRSDFEVRDNGQLQDIDVVLGEDQPLEVMLLLDVSGSLQGIAIQSLKRAALDAVDALRSGDHVRLVTFSHRILASEARAGDAGGVKDAIDRLEADGSTSLYDALFAALTTAAGTPRRLVALLFSDGRDNRSWLSAQAVIQVAKESEAVVYAVAFKPPWRSQEVAASAAAPDPDRPLLTSLTESTGGRLVWEEESRRLPALFVRLLEEMRSRYLLTYYPRNAGGPGWHTLTVRLKRHRGSVVARPGYYVR